MLQDLRDMIAAAENEGWHHQPIGTIERQHYDRLVESERRNSNAAKENRTQGWTQDRNPVE